MQINAGIIPFGSDDTSIINQCSCKSAAACVAAGWTVNGTVTFDEVNGATSDGTSGYLRLQEVANYLTLAKSGQLSITVPTYYVCDYTTETASDGLHRTIAAGNADEYFFSALGAAGNAVSGIWMGNFNGSLLQMEVSLLDTGNPNMYLASHGKGSHTILTLSWAGGKIVWYVNGKPIKVANAIYGNRTNFDPLQFRNMYLLADRGIARWLGNGSIADFIIANKPVVMAGHPNLQTVVLFGHSFAVDGGYTKITAAEYMDTTIAQEIEGHLGRAGLRTGGSDSAGGLYVDGLGGGWVSDTGATKLSSITATTAARKPNFICALMGANDAINLENLATYESELKLRVAELMSGHRGHLLLANVTTLKTHSTYDSASYVSQVNAQNAIHATIPSWWQGVKTASQGNIYDVDIFTATGGENPQTNVFLGNTPSHTTAYRSNIHPNCLGQVKIAEVFANQILQLLGI